MDQRISNRSGSGGDIIGIILSVDECGLQPAQTLKFWKSTTRVIEIGRRSAQTKGNEEDGKNALFRCPVISRRHAKITFSEYGNVYVTDLKSHHGTYIRRPGETVSRLITAEVPNVVADGDVITFGKPVGKDQDLVRPITARIDLQFGREVEPTSNAAIASRETTSPKNGSGRYGVFMPPSDVSSSSDSDSDVEEIPRPLYAPSLQTHGFEFNAALNDIVWRETVNEYRSNILRRHVLPPLSGFLTPSPEPPVFSYSFKGQNSSSDANSMEGSPEIVEVEAPVISAPSAPAETHSDALQNDLPVFIGAWPTSLQDSVVPSPSHTPPSEDNALTHVSSGEEVVNQIEEEAIGSRMTDLAKDDVLSAEPEAFTANVWAKLTPEAEISISSTVDRVVVASTGEVGAEKVALDEATSEQVVSHESDKLQASAFLLSSGSPVVDEQATATDMTTTGKTITNHVREEETTLQSLKQAMEEMHAQAQKEIEHELSALRAARAEAEAAAAQLRVQRALLAVAVTTAEAPATSPSSLKRKRTEDDVEDIHTADNSPHTVVQLGVDIPTIGPAPKRRRTLRIVSAVAQTTVVATLGAVAAWTALAFA